MELKQGDLFWGMDNDFVVKVMDETEKINLDEGDVLFRTGDVADDFYILIKGRIKLTIGDKGPVVYMAKEPGQVVGWSTLLGRGHYSATATCVEASKMVKVSKKSFLDKIAKVPESEALFFKRVAGMLGDRLISVYPSIA
jgi:CRP-like cAMP-binding protein